MSGTLREKKKLPSITHLVILQIKNFLSRSVWHHGQLQLNNCCCAPKLPSVECNGLVH